MHVRNLVFGVGALLGLALLILSQTGSHAEESPQATPTPAELAKTAEKASEEPNQAPVKKGPASPEAPAKASPKAPRKAPKEAPAASEASPDPLRQGSVLRPRREVLIGLAGIYRDGGATYAWFNAGTRAFTYSVEVMVGGRVRAGGHELEVLEVDLEQRWVRYAWTKTDASEPLVTQVAASGTLRLREMGVYHLADGKVLTVGNVSAAGAVSIRVFPKAYADDPMQGYDNHTEVQAGAALSGVRKLRVLQTSLPSETEAGWVEIELQ